MKEIHKENSYAKRQDIQYIGCIFDLCLHHMSVMKADNTMEQTSLLNSLFR